jgi:hypothetical protein
MLLVEVMTKNFGCSIIGVELAIKTEERKSPIGELTGIINFFALHFMFAHL